MTGRAGRAPSEVRFILAQSHRPPPRARCRPGSRCASRHKKRRTAFRTKFRKLRKKNGTPEPNAREAIADQFWSSANARAERLGKGPAPLDHTQVRRRGLGNEPAFFIMYRGSGVLGWV